MVLLFGGVPGGPELLIILLVLLVLFGGSALLLVVLGAGGLKLLGDASDGADDDRLSAVERELAETRAELRDLREEREAEEPDSGSDPGGGSDPDDSDYEASRSS